MQYDANGRLFQTIDHEAGITHTYEYDSLDRLIRAWQKNTSNGSVILGVENAYDSYGRAKGSTVITGGKKLAYTITYDEDTNLVSSVRLPTTSPDSAYNYDYDNFDRVITEQISLSTLRDYYTDYTYQTYTDDEGNVFTSNLVSTLILRVSSGGTTTAETYGYTYDNVGNITAVTKNGSTIRSYVYDSLNRLQRENDHESLTYYVYSYDNAGNILSKVKKTWIGTPLSTTTYGYSTSGWKDLLTNYNGTTITYDAIGNPLKWRNATSMTWDKRALQSMTLSDGTAVSFQHNADGIRTQKTVGSTTHSYVLDGTNIQSETVTGASNYTLYYIYDVSGSVIGFLYNNLPYYFQKNLQGDVIRILNATGTIVTEYKYDAWGNILSITGTQADTIGQYNPFRYRGYYYDTETGFYYLNSRYYDPQAGRFINADGIIGANGGIMGYNMFAYCSNNPVMFVDPLGAEFQEALAWGTSMGWLIIADGPLPIGDIAYWIGVAAFSLTCASVASEALPEVDIYFDTHCDELDIDTNVYEKSEEIEEPDPYARPGQKKQGRERKTKARKNPDWKPRSNPKPPKKHTPGRGHRKYK